MEERRKEKRRLLKSFASVTNQYDGRLIGYLYDLTTGGALVVSNKSYEIDDLLHLRIELPEDFERDPLKFDSRVKWIRPDDDPGYFLIGRQLLNLTPEELSTLGLLLSKIGSRSEKSSVRTGE